MARINKACTWKGMGLTASLPRGLICGRVCMCVKSGSELGP